MALQSMTALANITLQTTTDSVNFSNIPQNYRDLILVIQANRPSGSAAALRLSINGGTTIDGLTTFMNGNGSAAQAYVSASLNIGDLVAGQSQMSVVQIMDYSTTDKHKSYLSRFSRGDYATVGISGRWPYTNAITSISVIPDASATFDIGGTFSLYGRIA